ncbi:MAG: hypothetical protein H6598_03620 [Flavobacteriales bacterium]|nr:hypothetical protein [Flavobacteriales bacterium]
MKIKYITLALTSVILVACSEETTTENPTEQNASHESVEQIEEVVETVDPRIEAIDQIVDELNQTSQWDNKKKFEMLESTEGGELKFLYLGDQIAHIKEFHYGEMGRKENKYYLQDGQLVYTIETTYEYNAPHYMEGEFDITQTDTLVDESYFEEGMLFRRYENQDCGAPFADDYKLEEQKRIQTRLEELMAYLEE